MNLTGCTWGPAPPLFPLPVEQGQLLCGRLVAKPCEAKPEGQCIGGRTFDNLTAHGSEIRLASGKQDIARVHFSIARLVYRSVVHNKFE